MEVKSNHPNYKIVGARFRQTAEIARGIKKGEQAPLWSVTIEDSLFDTFDFLTISDETGEPLYAQSKHGVSEIIKDSNGKFIWKD